MRAAQRRKHCRCCGICRGADTAHDPARSHRPMHAHRSRRDQAEPREHGRAYKTRGTSGWICAKARGRCASGAATLTCSPVSMANPVGKSSLTTRLTPCAHQAQGCLSAQSSRTSPARVIPATEMPLTKEARTRGMRALRKTEGMKEEYDRLSEASTTRA